MSNCLSLSGKWVITQKGTVQWVIIEERDDGSCHVMHLSGILLGWQGTIEEASIEVLLTEQVRWILPIPVTGLHLKGTMVWAIVDRFT